MKSDREDKAVPGAVSALPKASAACSDLPSEILPTSANDLSICF
ncbi:hypothetical protein [Akkermansia sp.]|nr:hypothetical protein [Akkermansia sp.]